MDLEGRVAIITGAGRGIGREHALYFAGQGARVVVNDLGGSSDGTGVDGSAASAVVDEIRSLGGEAVANTDDIASWDGARSVVEQAVRTYGGLDVLVNNAGVLRDRVLVNMTEDDWDLVMKVHLKGHFAPLHFAANYWRARSKAGDRVTASVINTTSGSGLFGNPGQINYASAKAGIATMTLVAARELERYDVRVNAIAPIARTRLTENTPGLADAMKVAADGTDPWHPANISPLVAYLAAEECPLSGHILNVHGRVISTDEGWRVDQRFKADEALNIDTVHKLLADLPAGPPPMAATL